MTVRSSMLATIIVSGIVFASLPAIAQTLRLLQAADTDDATIGAGASSNVRQVAAYMGSVSKLASMGFDAEEISGAQFSCSNIRAKISSMTISPGDTVVFYYSAHGFRGASDTSRFPRFLCSGIAQTAPIGSSDELGLDEVATLLEAKHPKLLIVVADTCNHVATQPHFFNIPITPMTTPKTQADKMKSLFSTSSGYVLFSSSKGGEYSWYLPSGGYFTSRFLSSIDADTTDQGAGTWAQIISSATQSIWVGQTIQNPIADGTHLSEDPLEAGGEK